MESHEAPTCWLMKTEPDVFSFEDLVKAPARTTCWEGVRNYQARNFMRDVMKAGHQVLIYHSNVAEPGVVGVAEIAREAYPDPQAMNAKSPYYDEKAKARGSNPWVMVDVRATQRLAAPVTRAQLLAHDSLNTMDVLRKGNRLSVQPVSKAHFAQLLRLGKATEL